jgi:uncharacterized protein YxeA
MNKLHVLLGTIPMLTAWSVGLEGLAAGQKQWQGYLIDRQCAESVKGDSDSKAFVLHHTKDCALMPNCRATGYALFVDNKWYELDKRGNELAVKVLTASKKKRGFYVRVTGTAQGKVLKVESIKESEEPKPNNGAEKKRHGTD